MPSVDRLRPVAGSRRCLLVAVSAVLALVLILGVLAYVRNHRRSPIIDGPGQITAGRAASYTASYPAAVNFEWKDPNGVTRRGAALVVTGVVPGSIRISVAAVIGNGLSPARVRTIEVVAAPDGPTISGPDTVAVGKTATFTYTGASGSTDPTWIDPNGGRHPGDTFEVTARSAGTYRIELVVTRSDGTQIGAVKEITLKP